MGYAKHTDNQGVIYTITVGNGGTGYTDGDILTITGGDGNATVRVILEAGGVVQIVEIVNPGTGYSNSDNYPTTGGTGSGCTLVGGGYLTDLLEQPITVTAAIAYRIFVKIGGTARSVTVGLSGGGTEYTAGEQIFSAGAGNVNFTQMADGDSAYIVIEPSGDFNGTIDNVSVRQVLGENSYGPELVTNGGFDGKNGWSFKDELPSGWVYRGGSGNSGTLPTYTPSLASAIARSQQGMAFPKFIVAGQDSEGNFALFKKSNIYGFNLWQSQVFHVGFPFRVLETNLPLSTPVISDAVITPVLRFDNGNASSAANDIDDTTYPNDEQHITLTPKNFSQAVEGETNFFLELQFNGPNLMGVSLPITIRIQNRENGEQSVFTISSLFNGLQPTSLFGGEGQYLSGIGIDPDVPATDETTDLKTAGIIRPVSYEIFSGELMDAAAIAIITNPKNALTYAVLSNGKILSYDEDLLNETLVGRVQESAADVEARGADYYNNGIYVRTPHDVSRLFPLDDTPLIEDEFWTDELGMDPLVDAAFPETLFNIGYLNHFGTIHVDGALYFLDFDSEGVGIGYVHKIKTTTDGGVQGAIDDPVSPSAYGILDLPPDYIPITISPYGEDLVVSGSFTTDPTVIQGYAALFFFSPSDTVPSFYRKVALPDVLCSGLKYDNGILYGLSGDIAGGYRLFQYAGGDTIETLAIVEDGYPPLQGAVDYAGNRIVWAANTNVPVVTSGLYAYGSKSDLLPRGLHHIAVLSDFQTT